MLNITLEEAESIVSYLKNGHIDGWSQGKGGRVWLEGEFQLCELEAICVKLRHFAGEWAEGARELIDIQNENNREVEESN